MPGKYIVCSGEVHSIVDFEQRKFGEVVRQEYQWLACQTYQNYAVMFGWNNKVQLYDLTTNKVVWKSENVFQYQCGGSSLWCTFSKMNAKSYDQIFYITREGNRLIKIDLPRLVACIEKGIAPPAHIEI